MDSPFEDSTESAFDQPSSTRWMGRVTADDMTAATDKVEEQIRAHYNNPKNGFVTKDSGERAEFYNGGVRDTENGKARFDLLMPLTVPYEHQMLTRIALLLARGAEKYNDRNWEQFSDQSALDRAKSSAMRHMFQWLAGEDDEDHAAAVFFNMMVVEYVKGVLGERWPALRGSSKLEDLQRRLRGIR